MEKGDKYTELNPTIGLTFTDFVMFSQPQLKSQVITDFIFLENAKAQKAAQEALDKAAEKKAALEKAKNAEQFAEKAEKAG